MSLQPSETAKFQTLRGPLAHTHPHSPYPLELAIHATGG